jgi:hypothetical protein
MRAVYAQVISGHQPQTGMVKNAMWNTTSKYCSAAPHQGPGPRLIMHARLNIFRPINEVFQADSQIRFMLEHLLLSNEAIEGSSARNFQF